MIRLYGCYSDRGCSSNRRLRYFTVAAVVLLSAAWPNMASAQTSSGLTGVLQQVGGPTDWTSPGGMSSALQVMLLLTVLSIAPAILLMTTCFIRVIVVLGLLRQALGTQQLPPSQVITSISLFITLLVMTPTWTQVYQESIKPYTDEEITLQDAFDRGVDPIRRFMANQILRTENDADVELFLSYLPPPEGVEPDEVVYVYYDPQPGETVVPLQALMPAFMLSELKTAFLIGFQVYLPFVIIDIVVASITISMGMLMLPPVLLSLPVKLILFVLVDGWRLTVGMLLESFSLGLG